MNIFTKQEHIFGNPETDYLTRSLNEFFTLLNELRPKLGGKAYLLDEYVRLILEASEYPVLPMSSEKGFYATRELCQVMTAVLDNRPIEHPLYEEFCEFINNNPLPYQESVTRSNIYFILHISRYSDHAAKAYWNELWPDRGKLDRVRLRELYDNICVMLGSEAEMERLNLIIRQRFLIVTPMTGFIQGLTNNLVQTMMVMDPETRRYCYELAGELLSRSQD